MEDILYNLTEKQIAALKQCRKDLEDILTADHTDYVLLKFLRAGNFNLKKCEKTIRQSLNDRITFDIDRILETYEKPEVMQRYESTGVLGFAKDRSLIRYAPCGNVDFYGFIMSISTIDVGLYFYYLIESDLKVLKDENLRTGKNILEVTYILDMEGFSIQQVLHKNVMELGISLLCAAQDAYPDIWKNVLIINVPGIFNTVFNMFKPFIGSTAIGKIQIANKSSSKDLLLKYIDEDVLPVFLGGKRVDSNGDPRCTEFITFGGKIPEEFYSHHHRIPLMPTDPDVKCLTIRPRSTYNHCVAVREPGSKLRVRGSMEDASVGVRVFFKEFSADSNDPGFPAEDEYLDHNAENFEYKQIGHTLNFQTHCTQEDAILHWNLPGIYVFQLSNATSWFTSRKGMIKVEVIPPEQKNES